MLDTEALKTLPDEQKARLVEFEKTFSSTGWKYIVKWAQKTAEEQRNRLMFCQNWEQYLDLQAKWYVYTELSNLEDLTYKEFENLAAQALEAQVEEVEVDYE